MAGGTPAVPAAPSAAASNPPPSAKPGPPPTGTPTTAAAALPTSAPPVGGSTPPSSGGSPNVALPPAPAAAKASPEPTAATKEGAPDHAAATGEAADKSSDSPNEEHTAAGAEATVSKPKQQRFPVMIKTDPEDSRVSAGKHVLGTTPLTLKLRPGNVYELTFTKAGYLPVTQRYRFDAEEPQMLRVALAKKPEVAPKPAAKSMTPPPSTYKGGWFVR